MNLTNTANTFSTADASTYDFTSQSFGAVAGAGETRYIAVASGFHAASAGILYDSISAGGVAAVDHATATDTRVNATVRSAAVPTGTTGTVSVVLDGGSDGLAISVFRLIDPASQTASDTASDVTPVSGVLNLNTDIVTGGGAIGATASRDGGLTTWAGLTEVQDVDVISNEFMSAAFGTTAGAPRTITATSADTTPGQYVGCVAAWEPAAAGGARSYGYIFG